jgi:hypothetical protein
MAFTKGDFSCIADENTRMAFEDMYDAITKAEAWADVAKEPAGQGFMWSRDAYLLRIEQHLKDRVSHSGGSYAATMRSMQHLARVGWDAFIEPYRARALVAASSAAAVSGSEPA